MAGGVLQDDNVVDRSVKRPKSVKRNGGVEGVGGMRNARQQST